MKLLGKDALEKLRDNDLKKTILSLRSRIKELEKEKSNKKENVSMLKELQKYYCYVYRELEVRKVIWVHFLKKITIIN